MRPCPGKCLAQASAPASWQPSIQARTRLATRFGSSPKARVCTIGLSGSTSRSATGANTQLMPTARASCAVTRAGPAHHRRVLERSERERRRELGEPGELLPCPALEIGGDEERAAGAPDQVGREPPHRFDRAAEDDEAARPRGRGRRRSRQPHARSRRLPRQRSAGRIEPAESGTADAVLMRA